MNTENCLNEIWNLRGKGQSVDLVIKTVLDNYPSNTVAEAIKKAKKLKLVITSANGMVIRTEKLM